MSYDDPETLERYISPSGIPAIKTRRNTRIPCICTVRTVNLWHKGYKIGTISEEANDAGETDWVIRIDWEQWKKSGTPTVAGIDMSLRLEEYIRTYIPAFVEERTMPDTRDGLFDELEKLGMKYNDRFEFMCRTHGKCGPSTITVERQGVIPDNI